MKINDKVLSFPPYISTNWTNVLSLKMDEGDLIISLEDGGEVVIPGLNEKQMTHIFSAHARAVEKEIIREEFEQRQFNSYPFPIMGGVAGEQSEGTFKIGFGSMDNLGMAMQHNPNQANIPDIPKEALGKIISIARIVSGGNDLESFPKPEPHCNCVHCQISREVHSQKNDSIVEIAAEDEVVTDKDLQFSQWEISQVKDRDTSYKIVNRVDPSDEHEVSLKGPVKCSCGKNGCEHILAVLRS
jgi:hypothetical protein